MLGLQRNVRTKPGLSSHRLSIGTRRGAIGEEEKEGAYRRPGRLSFSDGAFKEGEEEKAGGGCRGGSAGCDGKGGGDRVRATAGDGNGGGGGSSRSSPRQRLISQLEIWI